MSKESKRIQITLTVNTAPSAKFGGFVAWCPVLEVQGYGSTRSGAEGSLEAEIEEALKDGDCLARIEE